MDLSRRPAGSAAAWKPSLRPFIPGAATPPFGLPRAWTPEGGSASLERRPHLDQPPARCSPGKSPRGIPSPPHSLSQGASGGSLTLALCSPLGEADGQAGPPRRLPKGLGTPPHPAHWPSPPRVPAQLGANPTQVREGWTARGQGLGQVQSKKSNQQRPSPRRGKLWARLLPRGGSGPSHPHFRREGPPVWPEEIRMDSRHRLSHGGRSPGLGALGGFLGGRLHPPGPGHSLALWEGPRKGSYRVAEWP